ncbi:MAG TPA: type II toxin-antitoxin system VapC family toxin [Casimicrobiaceae bacterium]|nr:type II toxin-antitoxin system VapC family toxin [Casimicrobiaceae bacterium]
MILADVNILVHAFRADSSRHQVCRSWLDGVVNGASLYGVSPQVLASVIRICTHPRIFDNPSKPGAALEFCKSLLEQPNATIVVPGMRHWSIFDALCRESEATGNLVSDAWFAALAIEAGCRWITFDRDYARFAQLDWRTPD